MKTKFTKVAVEERLPEKDGYYFTNNGYKYFFDILGFTIKTDWWLEESPDREDEMIEMLEDVVYKFDDDPTLHGYQEEILRKIKSLLQSLTIPNNP